MTEFIWRGPDETTLLWDEPIIIWTKNDSIKDRCEIVHIAQEAAYKGTPIIGIFKEQFYPYHEFNFIRYK